MVVQWECWGVKIFFLHYDSFKDAVKAWKRRVARIHWDNLFVVLSERDGCTMKDLLDFASLPFKDKVAFTHILYPNVSCSYHIKGFEMNTELGNIMDFKGIFGRKYYDQFDWVKFLNGKDRDEIINNNTRL